MADDDTLQRLRRAATEVEAERQRFDAWSSDAGDTTTAPPLKAEQRAAAEAAFEPLGQEFEERMIETLHAALTAPEPATRPRVARRRWLLAAVPAAAAAIAAAVLLALLPSQPGEFVGYRLILAGGDKAVRGPAADAATALSNGSRLQIILRPDDTVEGSVACALYVAPAATPATVRALEVRTTFAPTGAIRATGLVGRELDLAPGRYVVWAAVYRPGGAPDDTEIEAAIQAGRAPSPGPWQLLRGEIEIRGMGP